MIRIEKYEAARPMTVYKVGSIRKKQPQKCPHFYKRKKSLPLSNRYAPQMITALRK